MAISMKNWKDRITQYPNRRKLINVSTGEETIVDVVREEGNVTEAGDTFTAANMTDFESKIYNAIYPVGSIYMSVNNVNPSTLFGGTWVAWGAGRVPVGVDSGDSDFDTVEETGGEKTHTLTVPEMPSHIHTIKIKGSASPRPQAVAVSNWEKSTSYYDDTTVSGSNGSSNAHNNLQPYITCFMWKRVS